MKKVSGARRPHQRGLSSRLCHGCGNIQYWKDFLCERSRNFAAGLQTLEISAKLKVNPASSKIFAQSCKQPVNRAIQSLNRSSARGNITLLGCLVSSEKLERRFSWFCFLLRYVSSFWWNRTRCFSALRKEDYEGSKVTWLLIKFEFLVIGRSSFDEHEVREQCY